MHKLYFKFNFFEVIEDIVFCVRKIRYNFFIIMFYMVLYFYYESIFKFPKLSKFW